MFVVIAILTHHHCKYQQLILSQQFLNFTNIYISILKYFLCNAPLQKLSIFQSFCISVHKLYFFKNLCYTPVIRRYIK